MNAEEIKNKLSISDIYKLMEYYRVYPLKETTEYVVFTSICHNSESP